MLERLCDWAATLELARIPPDVLQRAAAAIADDLACATAAADDPAALRWAREAALVGPTSATAMAAARLAVQANLWQLDGGHSELMCHAGLYAMPALVADAQACGASLGEVLRAYVGAYELTCRLAAADASTGLHPHGQWSAAGAFAALALCRGLGSAALREGLAALVADADRVPFAHAVQGDESVDALVGAGQLRAFRRADGLDPEAGTGPAPPAALTVGLGRDWALRKAYHKAVACGAQAIPALEALLHARNAAGRLVHAPVLQLQVEAHAFAARMLERRPATGLAARFSIPHVLAVAWATGRTDPAALGPACLAHEGVATLRERVVFSPYEPVLPPPRHRAARVTVVTTAGTVTGHCYAARGSSGRPFTSADLQGKVRALAGARLERFLHAAGSLDRRKVMETPLAALLPPA